MLLVKIRYNWFHKFGKVVRYINPRHVWAEACDPCWWSVVSTQGSVQWTTALRVHLLGWDVLIPWTPDCRIEHSRHNRPEHVTVNVHGLPNSTGVTVYQGTDCIIVVTMEWLSRYIWYRLSVAKVPPLWPPMSTANHDGMFISLTNIYRWSRNDLNCGHQFIVLATKGAERRRQ